MIRAPRAAAGGAASRGLPAGIVALYAVVAALGSRLDRVRPLAGDEVGTAIHTAKGVAFVPVTSEMLYVLIGRRDRQPTQPRSRDPRHHREHGGRGPRHRHAPDRRGEPGRRKAPARRRARRDAARRWGRGLQPRHLDGSPVHPRSVSPPIRALAKATARLLRRHPARPDGSDVSSPSPPRPCSSRADAPSPRWRSSAMSRRRGRWLDELRDEFLSTAAHEFKTPLAVIKAYAQLLQKREPAEAQALVIIQRQVDRLNRLVQHLLDTTRLRLDGREGRPQRVDLAALAVEVIDTMRNSAPATTSRLHRPCPRRFARIASGWRASSRASSTTPSASPRGGAVSAQIDAREGQAIFSVEDHGVGISRGAPGAGLRAVLPRARGHAAGLRRARPRPRDEPRDRPPARRPDVVRERPRQRLHLPLQLAARRGRPVTAAACSSSRTTPTSSRCSR